ncbi:hypothetical protein PsorP6_006034 [Peronosclerospora sorghi]|uniref:Uncharacterized protein n=1 Tax=Peronosclerospora sorghi TaxID=230839 RepID=A0ACC0W354_9STRA|nr:hypothetical protein PsorP6_006034 [Peronosclerospora sorghi]
MNSSDDEEPQPQQVKSKKDESTVMGKLTDLVEEKQMDENKMKKAFQALRQQEESYKEAERILAKKIGGGEGQQRGCITCSRRDGDINAAGRPKTAGKRRRCGQMSPQACRRLITIITWLYINGFFIC